jgi:hypothetical protein
MIITTAGRALIASAQANSQVLTIDKIVFGYRDGLDVQAAPPADFTFAPGETKYTSTAVSGGLLAADCAVWSTILGASTGDFEFNVVALASGSTLVAVAVQPIQYKIKTSGFAIGNTIIKNLALQVVNVSDLTGITISASTWQQDLSGLYARLGHDHDTRYLKLADALARGIFPISKYYANIDFNTLTDSGTYLVLGSTNSNAPIGGNGTLVVSKYISTGGDVTYIAQRFYHRSENRTFTRRYANTAGWTEWSELATIAKLKEYALVGHDHDLVYAKIHGHPYEAAGAVGNHNSDANAHPGRFAMAGHQHDSRYPLLTAFANLRQESGYQKLPGNMMIQWGRTAAIKHSYGATVDVLFPLAFGSLFSLTAGSEWATGSSGGCNLTVGIRTCSNTGATFQSMRIQGEYTDYQRIHYIAIGSY